jgi:CheY-like chemotaxis protein
MQRQVDHLVDLVNELLDISRINTGKIELRREPTVLNAIVRDAVHSTQPDLDAARHHLSVELPDQSPIVHADAKRILQVLTNLLKNAAKFTEPGGHIAVSVAGDDQSVEVRVRDTGVGIPAGMLPRVFEMFSQVEDQLTRRHGGLGIGLSLAQSLVQLHGGTIEARSEGPGKGSEFILRLPTAAVSPEQSRQREAVDVPLVCEPQCIRVLVVDDNADAANSLLMVLSARGYDCQAAYDGETALKLAEAFQPRIFVLDIGMPGMSGYELARRLRSAPQFERATFVAVTGWGQEQDRRQSREAGFDHHFAKPVSVMALERVLTAASSNGEPELHAHAVPSGLARTAV